METSGINFSNAEAWQVQPSQLEEHWGTIAPFIEKWISVIHGEMLLSDVKKHALAGTVQIFAIHTCGVIKLVALTELVQYPQLKALRILGMAGEKPILAKKFYPSLELWGVANGATVLETYATPETIKINMRLGMSPLYTLMRKALIKEKE